MRTRHLGIALTAFLVTLSASHGVGHAGVNHWTGTGPGGGGVSDLERNAGTATTVYAATGAGLFKSTDSGGTWARSNALSVRSVSRVGLDPSNPNIIYAATSAEGMFKSVDGGTTWNPSSAGLTELSIGSVAIDPATPSTLYAGTSGSRVFKSTNGGATWNETSSGLPSGNGQNVTALVIEPGAPSTLYAGIGGSGVYKSVDAGGSWSAVNTGLAQNSVTALAIDPSLPSTLYATTLGGVFKSTSAGASWSAINSGLTRFLVFSVAIDPLTPSVVYAGTEEGRLFKTTNGGTSWTSTYSGLAYGGVRAITIDPGNTSSLLAGQVDDGVYKSVDGAGSWNASSVGLTALIGRVLVVHPTTPSTIYAGTVTAGLFRTTDGGLTWLALNNGLTSGSAPNHADIEDLVIDPTTPTTLYVGTGGGGVFKSVDDAASWFDASSGLTNGYVGALAIDPVNPQIVYAATNSAIFKSTDGAATWTAVAANVWGRFWKLVIDPQNPTTLYGGLEAGGPVLKSVDGGVTWNLKVAGMSATEVRGLTIDPAHPAVLYATTLGDIFKTTDGAESWTSIGSFPVAAAAAAIDPSDFSRIYVATSDAHVYRSRDGGLMWTLIDVDIPYVGVRGLTFVPSTSTLYANTVGSSVLLFQDVCGNGVLDPSEQCDEGAATGLASSCCTAPTCQLRGAGVPCRTPAGVCDLEETCTGAQGSCPADAKSTAVCRPASAACDAAESCDGVGDECPSDGVAASGSVCRPAAGVCDVAETCDGTSPVCPADAKSTAVCRPAANACDVVEACDGIANGCPVDDIGNGRPCDDGNACTVADTCSGGSCAGGSPRDCDDGNLCTDDGCNAATGCTHAHNSAACDDGLFCTVGDACSGGACVSGSPRDCSASGNQCNAGACDERQDRCAGAPIADGTGCDDGIACTGGDQCVAGQCSGVSTACGDGVVNALCGEQCDDGGTTGGDGCSATCMVEVGWACAGEPSECVFSCGNGTVDAAAGEICDDGDLNDHDGCSGNCRVELGWTCPTSSSSGVCAPICGDGLRVGPEQCDAGDADDGDGDGCEANCTLTPKVIPPTVVVAGGTLRSDLESDGATATDPLETAVTTPTGGTVSITRQPATGTAGAGFALLGQEVVISAPPATVEDPLRLMFTLDPSLGTDLTPDNIPVFRNGVRLPACSGPAGHADPAPACVANRMLLPNGEDIEITVLTIAASTWTFGVDRCGLAPATECRTPIQTGKSSLQIKNVADAAKDMVQWKWQKGAATTPGDLGDPTATTDYVLCVYDAQGLFLRFAVPPGGTCDSRACWSAKPRSFAYKDKIASADGVQQLQLKAGMPSGKAKIQLKGRGAALALPPALAVTLPVTAQLRNGDGTCWGATYGSPSKLSAASFSAKSD